MGARSAFWVSPDDKIESLIKRLAKSQAENAALCVEIEALHAKLADGQAVIRHKGHDKSCPALFCQRCFIARTSYEHWAFVGDAHDFEPGPCSDACGHDRTTGEKA